jgi:DNA-binding beta-propeller fold protein YncE
LSVINAAICNARDTAGCGQTAPTVAAGNGPVFVGIDDATHTLYVADQNSDEVTVLGAVRFGHGRAVVHGDGGV